MQMPAVAPTQVEIPQTLCFPADADGRCGLIEAQEPFSVGG